MLVARSNALLLENVNEFNRYPFAHESAQFRLEKRSSTEGPRPPRILATVDVSAAVLTQRIPGIKACVSSD